MMMWAGVSLSKRRIYRPLPVPIGIDRRHDQQPDNEPDGQADIFPVHAVPLFRFAWREGRYLNMSSTRTLAARASFSAVSPEKPREPPVR